MASFSQWCIGTNVEREKRNIYVCLGSCVCVRACVRLCVGRGGIQYIRTPHNAQLIFTVTTFSSTKYTANQGVVAEAIPSRSCNRDINLHYRVLHYDQYQAADNYKFKLNVSVVWRMHNQTFFMFMYILTNNNSREKWIKLVCSRWIMILYTPCRLKLCRAINIHVYFMLNYM